MKFIVFCFVNAHSYNNRRANDYECRKSLLKCIIRITGPSWNSTERSIRLSYSIYSCHSTYNQKKTSVNWIDKRYPPEPRYYRKTLSLLYSISPSRSPISSANRAFFGVTECRWWSFEITPMCMAYISYLLSIVGLNMCLSSTVTVFT